MTVLAQISDLHIVRPGARLLGRIDTAGFLARCVARLAALEPRPDAVVVTGDLVDAGTEEEYAHLRELLAPLPLPVHLVLGNHDGRAAFRASFPDARYAAGPFVQYAVDVGALRPLRLLALDTHDPGNRRGGGALCEARRAWLARELAAAGDRDVVIAMHHPPFATGLGAMDALGIPAADAAALAELVARHPRVQRVICGHLHRPIHARFAGTVASTAPSCAHQLALALDPAARLAFAFEPPGFALHVATASALPGAAPADGARGLASHHVYVDAFDGPHPF